MSRTPAVSPADSTHLAAANTKHTYNLAAFLDGLPKSNVLGRPIDMYIKNMIISF